MPRSPATPAASHRHGAALRHSPASPAFRPWQWVRPSIPRLVDQLVLGDPGHHGAQLGADLLDGVFGPAPAHRLEARLAGLALLHPIAGEPARLDVLEDALHLRLGLIGDDARSARVVAEL